MTKAPEMWKWRSAANTEYIGYDDDDVTFSPTTINVANFGVGFGLYFMMVHFYAPEWVAIIVTLILGFIWEVKNALVPYVKVDTTTFVTETRWMGGFGFSYKRELYGLGGVFLAFLLDVMWPPAIQPSREEDENSF